MRSVANEGLSHDTRKLLGVRQIRKMKMATSAIFIFHLHSAIKKGAPQARQVSDRWHLVKNLAACVSVQIAKTFAGLRRAEERRPAQTQAVQQAQQARQAERTARYEQILQLQRQGMKSGEIGRHAGDEPTNSSAVDRYGNHPLLTPETTTSKPH